MRTIIIVRLIRWIISGIVIDNFSIFDGVEILWDRSGWSMMGNRCEWKDRTLVGDEEDLLLRRLRRLILFWECGWL